MAKFNVIQSRVIHKRSEIYRGVPEKQLIQVPYRITVPERSALNILNDFLVHSKTHQWTSTQIHVPKTFERSLTPFPNFSFTLPETNIAPENRGIHLPTTDFQGAPMYLYVSLREGSRYLCITLSSWWLNQPLWKICSSNRIISPKVGMNIKNSWVATTQLPSLKVTVRTQKWWFPIGISKLPGVYFQVKIRMDSPNKKPNLTGCASMEGERAFLRKARNRRLRPTYIFI